MNGEPMLLITSMYSEGDLVQRLGRDSYSYRYVYRAFAPLLDRWGQHCEVSGSRSRFEQAVERRADRIAPRSISVFCLFI